MQKNVLKTQNIVLKQFRVKNNPHGDPQYDFSQLKQ